MVRFQNDVAVVRASLIFGVVFAQTKTELTKYETVPTPRLKDLVDSTLEELLKHRWIGVVGKRALEFATSSRDSGSPLPIHCFL